MHQPLHCLRRADQATGATPDHFARRPNGQAAAGRAVGEGCIRHSAVWPLLQHHGDDLRNDVAGALQDDGVADAGIEPRNLILVVQRRARHQHTAHVDRRQPSDGRQCAGAPDLDLDVL